MKRRKRISGYVIDLFISLAFCIVLSIVPIIIIAIITLLFLPFVASYEDTWNPILALIMNGTLLLGASVFVFTSLGTNFKFTFPLGYKFNGLKVESTNKFGLFLWWLIRNS